MSWGQAGGWLLVGFIVWRLYVSVRVFIGQCRVEHDRLVRLGLIDTEPSRINQVRRDPSPRPRDVA